MPNLSEDDYAKLQDLLKDPGLSDATRQRITGAIGSFEQQQSGQTAPAVDPSMPVVPQVLAKQPGTNHPAGDAGAESEWLSGGEGSAAGAVFVYEPPVAVAAQKLAENPGLAAAIGFNEVPHQQVLADLRARGRDSDAYRAFADYEWAKASQQATKAGRKAYRYSKAPWLHGGGALSAIESFGMKALGSAVPVSNAIDTFIMGVDDSMLLGAARGATEAVAGEPAEQHHAQLEEEHPAAMLAGQVVGALAPWGAAAKLYGAASKAGKALVGGSAGLGSRMLASGGSAALAGGAHQVGKEAVGAASDLAQGEDPGARVEGAPERVGDAALVSGLLGGGAEALGGAARAGAGWVNRRFDGIPERLARTGADKVHGWLGIKFSPETEALLKRAEGSGDRPGDLLAAEIAPAIKEGANREVKEAVAKVTKAKTDFYATREGKQRLPATNLVGRAVDILRRKHDAPKGNGRLQTTDVSGAPGKVRRILNNELATVSTKPSKNAIALTPEEAESFLADSWKRKLLPKSSKYSLEGKTLKDLGHAETQPEKLDAVRGDAKFSRGRVEGDQEGISLIDDPKLGLRMHDGRHRFTVAKERGDPTIYATVRDPDSGKVLFRGDIPLAPPHGGAGLAAALKQQGIDKVYAYPRRHTAESHEELIKGMKGFREKNPTMRELQELDEAARVDRDLRTMNGAPGGWSALQNENARLIGAAKKIEKLAAPAGDPMASLTRVQQSRSGELPRVQALQTAARRGGVEPELERLRLLDPLVKLKERVNFGRGSGRSDRLPFGPNAVIDAASIRMHPTLRSLGGPTSGLRGGQGGKFSLIGPGAPVLEPEQEQ